jgi:hypothetical protein
MNENEPNEHEHRVADALLELTKALIAGGYRPSQALGAIDVVFAYLRVLEAEQHAEEEKEEGDEG